MRRHLVGVREGETERGLATLEVDGPFYPITSKLRLRERRGEEVGVTAAADVADGARRGEKGKSLSIHQQPSLTLEENCSTRNMLRKGILHKD